MKWGVKVWSRFGSGEVPQDMEPYSRCVVEYSDHEIFPTIDLLYAVIITIFGGKVSKLINC